MKTLIFCALFFIVFGCSAKQKAINKVPQIKFTGTHIMHYYENYPKSPMWFEFTSSYHCKEPIRVNRLEHNSHNGKVKVYHIYVESDAVHCDKPIVKKTTKRVVLPIADKTYHIYLTHSSLLKLRSGH